MYCVNCGEMLREDGKFCPNCGTQIKKKVQENAIDHLIVKIQNGDQNAFEELYGKTQQYVRYYTTQFFRNDSFLVEDTVQDVYMAIFKNIKSLKDPQKAWGWIKTITRNTALNALEKNEKKHLLGEDEEYLLEDAQVTDTFILPENAMVQKETKELLNAMIEELPEKQRVVLFEHYYNGMKISEIAKEYDMLEGTVKCMLSRGRKSMEEKIRSYQKKTGVTLYAVSAAPFFYLLFREEIKKAIQTAMLPEAVASLLKGAGTTPFTVENQNEQGRKAAGTGPNGSGATGTETAGTEILANNTAGAVGKKTLEDVGKAAALETAKKAGGKALASKVLLTLTATAVVGTGVVTIPKMLESDEVKIERTLESFEAACREGDYDKIVDCFTRKSKRTMKYTSMITGALGIGRLEEVHDDTTEYELEVLEMKIDGDEATLYCQEVWSQGTAGPVTKEFYLSLDYEFGEWKIDFWDTNMLNL